VSACACGLVAVSGAVRIETFEDRIRDFSESWNQLFGYLNFTGIDEYEERYRGIFEKKNQQTVVCVGCLREGGGLADILLHQQTAQPETAEQRIFIDFVMSGRSGL